MGLAASQGRFLSLTARKTNVEYEGQQINQSRTALSNQSASYTNQSLAIGVPVPPIMSQYTKTTYSWVDQGGQPNTINSLAPIAGATAGSPNYNITTTTNPTPQPAVITRNANGRMTSAEIAGVTYNLTVTTDNDDAGYNDAMAQYEYKKIGYQKALDDLNGKQTIIQAEDKKLEIQLKQLDTEQQAISTELDAVKKVIDKNVESTFKIFA